MKRLSIVVCLVLLLGCFSFAEGEGGEAATGKVKDGYALLSDLTGVFSNIVQAGGIETAKDRLEVIIASNGASFAAGQIDPIFYHRMRRLLLIFKLIMLPMKKGNDVWEIVIQHELPAFAYDTLGKAWTWDPKDRGGIELMASAIEEEFVNLWIYLDTLPKRAELKQKFHRSMLPPPPAPAKK
ncbi:MAG TPA: hypothetical protein PKK12_10070 [Candidatus Aminicenantes bacterium]|nr:hypothetical protein [Candidatus Aminicenantes bacterium]